MLRMCWLRIVRRKAMQIHVTYSILLLAFLVMLPRSVVHGEECKRNYETILFPSGMPTSVGWDGKIRVEQFRCYAETALSSDVRAIVSAEEVATGSADSIHKVGLAIISLFPDAPKILHSTDITSSIPVYVEGPGSFRKMNAVAETVNGGNNLKILHINMWAVLSGSGNISGASDLFYVYREPWLSPVALEIRNSSMFSKENIVSRSKKASELFLSKSDAGITLYIVAHVIQTLGPDKENSSESTEAYLLHGDR